MLKPDGTGVNISAGNSTPTADNGPSKISKDGITPATATTTGAVAVAVASVSAVGSADPLNANGTSGVAVSSVQAASLSMTPSNPVGSIVGWVAGGVVLVLGFLLYRHQTHDANAAASTAAARAQTIPPAYEEPSRQQRDLYDNGNAPGCARAVGAQSVYTEPSSIQKDLYDNGDVPGAGADVVYSMYAETANQPSVSGVSGNTYEYFALGDGGGQVQGVYAEPSTTQKELYDSGNALAPGAGGSSYAATSLQAANSNSDDGSSDGSDIDI
jgi:hypothetical protein